MYQYLYSVFGKPGVRGGVVVLGAVGMFFIYSVL